MGKNQTNTPSNLKKTTNNQKTNQNENKPHKATVLGGDLYFLQMPSGTGAQDVHLAECSLPLPGSSH